MKEEYLTISKPSEGTYKEKGSLFVALAIPFADAGALKTTLLEVKSKHHSARHYCFAYAIGPTGEEVRSNDDGEPNNSAGPPILGQIRSKGLTNVLVVVVRYFGGSKLGLPGLIKAYKVAAAKALANAKVITEFSGPTMSVQFEYSQMKQIMQVLDAYESKIISKDFGEKCHIVIRIKERVVPFLLDKFDGVTGVQISELAG